MANAAIANLRGKPRYWKEGEIYWFADQLVTMAYAVTSDPTQVRTIGIVNDTYVEFISEQQRELWEDACRRQS
jgi:hypothetical protein